MSKYSDDIIKVRKLARELLPKILDNKSKDLQYILAMIKKKYPENCDDETKCQCGEHVRKSPEWQHQVRWAIQDLRYHKVLAYDKKSKLYSLVQE